MRTFNFVASIVISLVTICTAGAQYRPVAQQDQFFLNETGIRDTGNRDTNAKSLRSQTINTGIKNLILFAAGQSNMEGSNVSGYTPTNGTVIDNFNFYDGAIYNAVEPLAGSGAHALGSAVFGYHPALVLADSLVTAGKFDRIIIVPFAIGGSTVADWTTGSLGNRFAIAVKRVAQRGIVAGTNVTFALMWGQGESDNQSGTSQVNYVAGFNALVAAGVAAGWPSTARIFVAKQTYNLATTSAPVQAAQTATTTSGVINNAGSPPIYLGANADALVGSVCNGGLACRQADNTHFTTDGVVAYATDATNGWKAAMAASGAPF